jgi:hypothetical protein
VLFKIIDIFCSQIPSHSLTIKYLRQN